MMVKIGNGWFDPSMIAAAVPTLREAVDGVPSCSLFLRCGQRVIVRGDMDEIEDDLLACRLISDQSEHVVPQLSHEELAELKHLYVLGYTFIARDLDGRLYAFADVPTREDAYWIDRSSAMASYRMSGPFEFVEAGGSEPWAIEELI